MTCHFLICYNKRKKTVLYTERFGTGSWTYSWESRDCPLLSPGNCLHSAFQFLLSGPLFLLLSSVVSESHRSVWEP